MDEDRRQMDRHLLRVAGIIDLASSKKITDRRKVVEELLDIYDNNVFVKAINIQSSVNFKSSTSWNEIMIEIHQAALYEAHRPVGKSGKSNRLAFSYTNLMRKTVWLATKTSNLFLSCNDLMACILEMLREKVDKAHQETYCNILVNYVLSNEMYCLKITADQWQEALRLTLKLYKDSSSTFKTVLLDTVRLIVQYGCMQSRLLPNVMKILRFLEKIYQEIHAENKATLKPLYKLTYTVCQQISTENRIALCEFSEKSLPSIICLETCPEKIDMLLLLVQIHHPGGLDLENNAGLVRDPDLWRNIIRGIHKNILRDIKMKNPPPSFWKLCCEVYRQIIRDPSCLIEASSSTADRQDEQPRKRRRLLMAVRKPTDLLMNTDPDIAEPFIRILTELLRKYPDSLAVTDYPLFLKNVTKLVDASLNNQTMVDSLFKLCSVIIEVEKTHFHAAKEVENVRFDWAEICMMVIRILSGNRNEIFGHELLQSIIKKKNVLDTKQFLYAYLQAQIYWSYSSVETLLTFCTHVPIPNKFSEADNLTARTNSSTRASLLHWALNIPSGKLSAEIPAVSLANLLTALAMKFSYTREFRDFLNDCNRIDRKKIADAEALESELFSGRELKALSKMEQCHLALEFRGALIEFPEEPAKVDTKVSKVLVPEVFDALISSLSTSLSTSFEISVTDRNVSILISKLTVIAKLLSNFLELDAKYKPRMSSLLGTFCEVYKRIQAHLMSREQSTSLYLVHAFEALEILYRNRYDCRIGEVIVESTSTDFIIHIFDFLSEDDEDSENEENREEINVRNLRTQTKTSRLSDICRMMNSSHKILVYFSCCQIGQEISPLQIRVLKNIMKADICKTTSSVDIRRALSVLKVFAQSEQYSTNEESLKIATGFLENLFETRRKDEFVIRGILNVLPNFLTLTQNLSSGGDFFLSILGKTYSSFHHQNYGTLVHADFIKCLAKLIHRNPLLKWEIEGATEMSPIIEILPSYINSPFYVVRLEVVRALHVLFSSEKLDVNWKVNFFGKIINAISELLSIPEMNDACGRADELSSRTATAIHILVGIIPSNAFLQSRALYAIIELSIQYNVKMELIKRALFSATKDENERRRLLEVNLYDLLSRWLRAENSLEIFPWTLMDCSSQEDFSRKYIDILLTLKLQRLELQEFEILCNDLEILFPRTIEQFFPIVVSLLMSMIVRESSRQEAKSYALQMWQRLRSNADEFASIKKFDDLLQEKLPELVVDILQRLNDREHLFTMLGVNFVLPKQHSPNFKAKTVDGCLRYLKMQFTIRECSFVEYLVVRHPNVVQRILLELYCNVQDARTVENKILAFHQYSYFYNEIFQKISLPQFDLMSFYIVRDLSHSLLAFMADKTSISAMACSFFQIFLRKVLPVRADEITPILSFAVSKLVTIIRAGKVKSAIDVLRCLIIDHREVLAEAIAKLDSFPNDAAFETVKQVHISLKYPAGRLYSLEDEIRHFLSGNSEETLSCNFESLLHIQNQLSTKKDELREMCSKFKRLQDLQDVYASNTLHRLIYKLVRITKSRDTNISLLAAKCLGELGPADLMTTILHMESGYCKEIDGEVEMLAFNVIHLLVDYLVENDSSLRKASTDALTAVFSTRCGANLKEKLNLDLLMSSYGIEKPNLHNYIHPFDSIKTTNSLRPISIDEENWEMFVNQSYELWTPSKYDSYSKWLIDITCRCLDCIVNFCTEALKPVCKLSVEFCEMLLPRLLHLVTKTQESLLNDVCVCVNRYFVYVFELIRSAIESNKVEKKNVALSYECVKCMLNVVNFMRIQTTDCVTLAFDYLLIAKAAQYCSAHCTSVFYAELWCENILRDPEMQQKRLRDQNSAMNLICKLKPERGKLLQEIVREAYMNLGVPDCIYGCGLLQLIRSSIRTQHYIHRRKWDKVALTHDVALTSGRNATRGMINALNESGHQYLLKILIDKADKKSENVADYMYETAWRLADWSIIEKRPAEEPQNPQNLDELDYYAAHYRALQALYDVDATRLETALKNARKAIVQSLRNTSLESSQTLYPILSRLQMLQEIEKFATKKRETCNALFNDFRQQNFIERNYNFQYVEPILTQRVVMMQMKNSNDNIADIDVAIADTQLKIAEIAKTQGYFPIAYRVLGNLMRERNLSEATRNQLIYQKALLDWKENDNYMGRLVLRNLVQKSSLDKKLRAKALRVYGNWMAETTCERSKEIISKYYDVSIETSFKINDIESMSGAQADLAKFADARYQQILEFTETSEHKNVGKCMVLKNDAQTRKAYEKDLDIRRAVQMYERQAAAEAEELKYIQASKEKYLILAIRNYLSALATGNRHDLLAYRVVSLWFDNMNHADLTKIVEENLPRVASHKFVALLPQLATHMSNAKTLFAEIIRSFMKRCAKDHPHHTLPVLLALKNMHEDQEFLTPTGSSQEHSSVDSEPRIIAVNALISELAKSNIRPVIQQTCQLFDALISLAYYKVPKAATKKPEKTHNIPRNQAIMKIRDFHHALVPTVTLDVRPSTNYENVVYIIEYEATFELLGGVSAPKKIACVDSNGKRRRQLLKSEYNASREAVLQQVCTTMNSIFKATEETERRKLRIRTYKIVPLSWKSGVLEWCQGAVPISQILCDSEKIVGMHTKYNPNDWSVEKCRKKLREVRDSSYDTKCAAFIECCENLHPAFQYYFMEEYPSMETWFEKRLAYVRSVATNSMVGYMLSLGDRTPEHILLDKITAEVIHVDYGLAFDEKKVLSTLETVPFRLTRDMEAAMGICGVEGVMKRSCEQTVTVLREKRQMLITLLQVLLYDPLFTRHQPDLSGQFRRIQTDRDSAMKTNKFAERALLKMEKKLEGMEDGAASSVSGQVERLLKEARDFSKLCRMHYDWQPYL